MAAGVGKTYRMLQEGRAELEAGRDVVIGLLKTHGRAGTAALADGLEIVPRRRLEHRGTGIEEMDLAAILARAPEVCLIDELAHSNAPGAGHVKRFEDIEAVLDAGIDVLSTVNIQHLESLNDRVAELSGVRVRETIPDDVLGRADEIVLIDLSPEALLGRLRAGKIYPAERIEPSLNGFFRIENLSALREVALREVAEESESRRLESPAAGSRDTAAGSGAMSADSPRAVAERLLALVEPVPSAQRLVRRAWRSAQRLGAQLDLLWVAPPARSADPEQERQLAALRRLASVLGTRLLVEDGEDVAATIARVARRQGTTYILLGRSRRAARPRTRAHPLPQRLMDALPGVDVRIVADRSRRPEDAR